MVHAIISSAIENGPQDSAKVSGREGEHCQGTVGLSLREMGKAPTHELQGHSTIEETNRDDEVPDILKNEEETEPYYSQVLSVIDMDNKGESTCEMNLNICYNIVQSVNASVAHI